MSKHSQAEETTPEARRNIPQSPVSSLSSRSNNSYSSSKSSTPSKGTLGQYIRYHLVDTAQSNKGATIVSEDNPITKNSELNTTILKIARRDLTRILDANQKGINQI